MEKLMDVEQKFKADTERIKLFMEFYQLQGLAKHKALELAVKSVGVDCVIDKYDMSDN